MRKEQIFMLNIQRNGPNRVWVGGEVRFEDLETFLGGSLGRVRVLDKTGNSEKFNFVLEFAMDENMPGASSFSRGRRNPPTFLPGKQSIARFKIS